MARQAKVPLKANGIPVGYAYIIEEDDGSISMTGELEPLESNLKLILRDAVSL